MTADCHVLGVIGDIAANQEAGVSRIMVEVSRNWSKCLYKFPHNTSRSLDARLKAAATVIWESDRVLVFSNESKCPYVEMLRSMRLRKFRHYVWDGSVYKFQPPKGKSDVRAV